MKFTTLYMHDSTACWMQWKGNRLLQVYCESVTRELVDKASLSSKKDGIQSSCPWLSVHSPQVRLLIDPVADQTQLVPAFDYGFDEPHGALERLRLVVEQVYLTIRSLTSDALADDLTQYRHDRLKKYPKALLQWHRLKTPRSNSKLSDVPRHWLVSDSGLSDNVFAWLNAMADNGLEFLEVQAVCSLFAKQDAHLNCTVITIWVQSNRSRLIQCESGFVYKVEQWNNPVEARIALEESVSILNDDGKSVLLRYIGSDDELALWQEAIPTIVIQKRCDRIADLAKHLRNMDDVLPEACLNLPLNALIRHSSVTKVGLWSRKPQWEAGASMRILLSIARWKRRYKQAVVATTLAAALSGYFVLLAVMHAIQVIELHQRASTELDQLKIRHSQVHQDIKKLSGHSGDALSSIERLYTYERITSDNEQEFLRSLSEIIKMQRNISIDSVSWRMIHEANSDKTFLNEVTGLDELRSGPVQIPVSNVGKADDQKLLLISGGVTSVPQSKLSHQESSDVLVAFLEQLAGHEYVVEVMVLKDVLSDNPLVNLPSDVVVSSVGTGSFVLAILMSV